MSELKPLPCPFCGGINIINCGLHKYCHSCGAEGPDADNGTDAGLLSAWNRRAQPAQAGQVLTLDEVRESVHEAGLDWHNGWTMGEDAENRYLNLCRAIEQAVLAKRVPMTREEVKDLARKVGYDNATAQERADFINGIRHAEVWHGIVGEKGGA